MATIRRNQDSALDGTFTGADSPPNLRPVPYPAGGATAEFCAETVMDTVPLVMRFIRAHVQGGDAELPSVAQIRVLSCLTSTPGASLSDVARFLSVTKATASNMVARMVEKGLVERLDDPNERRCVMLHATATGTEVYRIARSQAQGAVTEVLQNLSTEQKVKIAEGLQLLKEAFQQ